MKRTLYSNKDGIDCINNKVFSPRKDYTAKYYANPADIRNDPDAKPVIDACEVDKNCGVWQYIGNKQLQRGRLSTTGLLQKEYCNSWND